LATNPWAASTVSQSGANRPWNSAATGSLLEIDQVQASFSTSASNAPWPGQNAAGTSGAPTSPANPLQSFASDIQAMLIQAQNAFGSGGAAGGTTTNATPGQAVANDLQALMGDLQAAAAPNTQTANSNPTAPTGAAGHHHHHHRHDGGGEANGQFDVAAASASGTQSATGQSVSATFATDIAQAIQAYGGGAAATAMPALTA
jgi:hypothetical protein